MSAKLSYLLSNKEKSSKKSAGFLTGIFKLFDCHFLLGLRQNDEQNQAKSSSADTTIILSKQGADCGEFWNMEHNQSKIYQQKLRSSSESNSSLNHRLPKVETKSPNQSTKSRSTDINQNQSPDFRKSINKSLYKDHKNDSAEKKTMEKLIKRKKVLKPVDSPRPIDPSKMKELEESLEILIKLRDLPNNFHEENCSPRFSYDGKICTDITLKEKKRLSLDSMGDSPRCEFKSKVNSPKKEFEKKCNNRISEASNENHNNIVAKLMGLGPIHSSEENYFKRDKQAKEQNKQEIMLQSASNSPKSQNSNNRHTKSDSNLRLLVKETQKKITVDYVEGNMKEKIKPVHNVMEKTLNKLDFQQNNKEIKDLKRVLLERKNSEKILRPNSKTEKSIIKERALKSPFVGKKTERKSADIYPFQCSKLESPSGLRKIRICDSIDKNKEFLSEDGVQSPIVKTPKCLNSPTKEKGRREGNPNQVRKSCAMINSYELKRNQKQSDNRQQSESVSPSNRIRQKSNKSQLNEGKSNLFHQTKGKITNNATLASKNKQNQMLARKNIFVKELEKIAPQISSPNSVLDDSPYNDDLSLSPLSISSISNVEDENLSTDHNLRTNPLSQDPQNLPSTSNFLENSQKEENQNTKKLLKFILAESITDNNTEDNKYVAELLLSSDLLTKDSHFSSMLKEIMLIKPLEIVEKSNSLILHKKLVYDVVNEFLRRKLESFSNGCQQNYLLESNMLGLQLLFKEICLEIKYLQTYMNQSIQEKDRVFTKDLFRRSNAWDRFDCEVSALVSEIESLIYIDLINEIMNSLISF